MFPGQKLSTNRSFRLSLLPIYFLSFLTVFIHVHGHTMKTVCKQRHFDNKRSFSAKCSWRTTDITPADPQAESNATVHEIRNHPVVNLNGISTGQSIEGAEVAVADNSDVLLREIAAQLAELNGKISSIGLQPSGSPLPERQGASAAVLRSIGTQELQEWSPTQEDVDAYLDSLEHEVSEESVLMRQCQGEERRAAATTKARHSNGPVLFWCAMAAAIACLGWLLQIIYDSPK